MGALKWAVMVLAGILTGCKAEVRPQLSLEGHWRVHHGFDPGCQVSMTFTGNIIVVAFYDLTANACRSDIYGLKNHVLAIQIDERTDFINEDGVLSATLKVWLPARNDAGSVTLWQTEQGLAVAIVDSSGPDGLLGPLLGPTYHLRALPSNSLAAINK